MRTREVLLVAGARPNFMKVAPIMHALEAYPEVRTRLLHTGQHYDAAMSEVFFRELELPEPDLYLGVGSGTQAEQTARIMVQFERAMMEERPDLVVVVGDVNSTLACALVAAKAGIELAHVEAGLRSFDRTMPEEINRLVTDSVSDLLFTTSEDANENLLREGHAQERIHFVGNTMIDTLTRHREAAETLVVHDRLGLERGAYVLVTLHRPANVDDPAGLREVLTALDELPLPVVFPVHPRTLCVAADAGLEALLEKVGAVPPLGYLEFLSLQMGAAVVLTDSGGVQEETTALRVPCLTFRENTERPVTVERGTNRIIGTDSARIPDEVKRSFSEPPWAGEGPPLWDGRAGERIAATLAERLAESAVA